MRPDAAATRAVRVASAERPAWVAAASSNSCSATASRAGVFNRSRVTILAAGCCRWIRSSRWRQDASEPAHPAFDPRYEKQTVEYHGREGAGTIVIDTPNKFLFWCRAMPGAAYGIASAAPDSLVGR